MKHENVSKAIHIAQKIAKEHRHKAFSPAHLLKAILHKDFPLLRYLFDKNIDVYFIEEWAEVRIESSPKGVSVADVPKEDDAVIKALDEAERLAMQEDMDVINLIIVFIAIITPDVCYTYNQLKTLPVSYTEVLGFISGKNSNTKKTQAGGGKGSSFALDAVDSQSPLEKYCTDKREITESGAYSNIFGRDNELKKMAEILSRRSKPHVLVRGEAGVGKTALINRFTHQVQQQKLLKQFSDIHLYELNTAMLFSGASYKGEVEDRLQSIFEALKKKGKSVLFIDEIHTLFDKQNSGASIANIIKSELSKGEITFIGITSHDEYRKTIAADNALDRRFESLTVEEPDFDLAFRILKSISVDFETHHELSIEENVLKEAIRLSKRYLKEKSLPDSAIDLIDRTMAALKVSNQSLQEDIEQIQANFEKYKNESFESDTKEIEEIHWLYIDLKNRISPIILESIDDKDIFKLKNKKEKLNYVASLLEQLVPLSGEEQKEVTEEHLATMVSAITGIPAGKVKMQERERLMSIEGELKKRVIGQDYAIKKVSEAIIESRSGLSKAGQPIGSFFFSGPTGTGKTELAKSLAEFLFGDENAIIRFDMSEFKEEHSAALLYGAPPGYVGYEEGGVLVNKIRQKPYAIVLFDEIEKAHQSVFDVFLQILDEGKIHDRLGKEGDFSNAVILFTSNIGADFISKSIIGGGFPTSNQLLEIMSNYFRPEFLGRLTEIVPFSPILEEYITDIFNLHLKKELLNLTEKLGIQLSIDEDTRKQLALKGFSPTYGVRPLKSVIRNELKRPLSKMIISGDIKPPEEVMVLMDDDEVKMEKQNS